MKGCKNMKKKLTWNDLMNRINNWLNTHQSFSEPSQASDLSNLRNVDFIHTVKYKYLTSLKKDRYLLAFAQAGWDIQSLIKFEQTMLIVWEKSFQKRGWKVLMNPKNSIVSIDEYELI